ncbi:hypothetical protein V8F20_001282 [Naviculisporaceae sp. PSN 640]
MTKSSSRGALKQRGFYIDPGFAFPDQETSVRIYVCLLGPEFNAPLANDEGKARAATSLAILFRAVLGQSALFKALHGSDIVWEMIAARANLFDEISAADAKVVVETMCAARQAYRGKTNHVTELTRLADQCIALAQETSALGPAHTFTVAQRDSYQTSGNSPEVVETLTSTLGSLNLRDSWPPLHFVVADCAVLSHPSIREKLENNGSATRDLVASLPSCQSLPLDLVAGVASSATRHYQHTSPWALFLSPVAYMAFIDRREWYFTTGQQSRLFATLASFLAYAKDAFKHRQKSMVMGMLVYWQGTPSDFRRIANMTRDNVDHLWTSNNFLKRYASVMILRPAGESGELQMVWYDPWRFSEPIQQQYKPRQMALFDFRNKVVERVRAWALENGSRVHSRYWGGLNSSGAPDDDSVKMACGYLELLTSGRLVLPDPLDKAGFEALGYMKTE